MVALPDKKTAFIDWYLAAIEASELTDKRYPVKGLNVWTPYGLLARRRLDAVVIRELERIGSHAVEFPTLIPQTEFQKEKEHIKGFDAQVYWVTKGGNSTLDVPLVLRPTSETAMYPVFALWVRSHQDLPLNVFQVVNVFRYETKTTRPFLRIREVHFYEEHTCQVDEGAATQRVRSDQAAFAEVAHALCLPYLALRRPDWDKFAGAVYSVALDVPVGEARTLQVASIHHYQENFSRAYGITYEDSQGKRKYVHQTTFGLSERLIGTTVAVHGDTKGIALPSELAPYQVVIVPIPGAGSRAKLDRHVVDLGTRLGSGGLRVHVDQREDRPGSKYYHWEARGVPLRIEVGARELARGGAVGVDRLGRHHDFSAPVSVRAVARCLADYDDELRRRAGAAFAEAITPAARLEELKDSRTIRRVPWCGREECGHAIEKAMDGSLLGTPEPAPPRSEGTPGPCIACGETSNVQWAYGARPL